MKIRKYYLHKFSPSEKEFYELVFLDEIERQGWYLVTFVTMWKEEILVSIQ